MRPFESVQHLASNCSIMGKLVLQVQPLLFQKYVIKISRLKNKTEMNKMEKNMAIPKYLFQQTYIFLPNQSALKSQSVYLLMHTSWCSFMYPCTHLFTCSFTCLLALCSRLSVLLNGQTHPARSLRLEVDLMGFSCNCVSPALLWQSPQFEQELDLLPPDSIGLSSTNMGQRDHIWQVQQKVIYDQIHHVKLFTPGNDKT